MELFFKNWIINEISFMDMKGWWVSSEMIYPTENLSHKQFIINNPNKFGLTPEVIKAEGIDSIVKKYIEPTWGTIKYTQKHMGVEVPKVDDAWLKLIQNAIIHYVKEHPNTVAMADYQLGGFLEITGSQFLEANSIKDIRIMMFNVKHS